MTGNKNFFQQSYLHPRKEKWPGSWNLQFKVMILYCLFIEGCIPYERERQNENHKNLRSGFIP